MRIPIANAFTNFAETARDFVFGNLIAVHANAFAKTDEVRGGEQTSPMTCGSRQSVGHCANRAFAIRARDVDDPAASAFQLEGGALRRRCFTVAPCQQFAVSRSPT